MTEKLDEIKEAIEQLRQANLEALETLTRHDTDLRWIKGSIKISFSAFIAGIIGIATYCIKLLLNIKGV